MSNLVSVEANKLFQLVRITMTGVEIVIPSGGKTRVAGPEVRER